MQHLSNGDCLVRYRNDSGLYRVRQLQIMICTHTHVKAKFHYAILVADRSEAGRRPAASWNLAYHLARYRFRPVRSQIPLRYAGRRPGRRPAASWNLAYHTAR